MYIQQLGEIFPPPNQNTVGACDQITCQIFYCISSSLVTLLKVTDAPIQVPYNFNPAVSFKIFNFGFQKALFLFLKCLLASLLTLFVLSTLL